MLFKLKTAIDKNKKVLIFVDGNKGSVEEKKNNLYIGTLKDNPIYFHQGFGALSYMLKLNILTGIIINKNEEEITIDYLVDNDIPCNLLFKEYTNFVSSILTNRLDRIILVNNMHLWNNISSIYQWFIIEDTVNNEELDYVPFELGGDYFAMEHSTFKAYSIKKSEYKALKKDLNMP